MARRAKRSVLTLQRQRAKDVARTLNAHSPGGRYYKPTVTDQVQKAWTMKRRRKLTD